MINKISLSGLAGSGKTSIGKKLADKLGFEFESIGNYSRRYANHMKMNINEFQNYCKQHPETDKEIDSDFSRQMNENNRYVIDYRLAYKYIDNCFHVYLSVSNRIAAKRLSCANRSKEFETSDVFEIERIVKERNESMVSRFQDLYNTDFTNPLNYNLVIDTDNKTEDSIIDIIIRNYNLIR